MSTSQAESGSFGPAESEATASAAPSALDRAPPRWVLLVLLCIALIVRGRVMMATSDSLNADPQGYQEIAWRIYNNGQIAMYRVGLSVTSPTASRPPLYPIVLAGFRFSQLPMNPPSIGWLHVVLGVITVAAVWRLARLWRLSAAASLLAAGLVTVDPILLNQMSQFLPDTLAALLGVGALIAMTKAGRTGSVRQALAAGVLGGTSVLCEPAFLAWLVVAAVVLGWRASGAERSKKLAAVLGGAAIVLAPWVIRNQIVFGFPIITTTSGGYQAALANNPMFYSYLRRAPFGTTWDSQYFNRDWESSVSPVVWVPIAGVTGDYRLLGTAPTPVVDELAQDQRGYRLAQQTIADEPATFAHACLTRVGWLWGVLPHARSPDESTTRRGLRFAVAIWYVLELSLAGIGVWFLRRKLFAGDWVWGTLLVLSWTAIHAFYWTDLSSRAQLMSVVALLAANGVIVLAERSRRETPAPQTV